MLYTTHKTSCCIPHPFVIAPTYCTCMFILVFVYCAIHLCLTSVFPCVYLAFLPPPCAVHRHSPLFCQFARPTFHPISLPHACCSSPFICACTLSLSHTRFRSQLYISHNTCSQVENKTTFITLLSVTSFGALTCAGLRTTQSKVKLIRTIILQ